MPTLYFEHTVTKKRFKVVGEREEDGKTYLTLECPAGTFEELFTKQRFKNMKYRPVLVDEDDDED